MNGWLDGSSYLVTGATGIAAASARHLAAGGAGVFVISIEASDCESLSVEIEGEGGTCRWAAADLRDEEATAAAFAEAVAAFDRLDGVLGVVGGSGRRHGDGATHEIPLDGWEATLALNLRTAFLTSREALRVMLGQSPDPSGRGSLVLMTSVLAEHPAADHFTTHAYATAKGGVIALTRAMAARYASDQIRVNAIAPAVVETPMSGRAAADPATAEYVASRQPLAGGFLAAEDVAAAAAYLLSPGARHVTGQILGVDGGWSVSG